MALNRPEADESEKKLILLNKLLEKKIIDPDAVLIGHPHKEALISMGIQNKDCFHGLIWGKINDEFELCSYSSNGRLSNSSVTIDQFPKELQPYIEIKVNKSYREVKCSKAIPTKILTELLVSPEEKQIITAARTLAQAGRYNVYNEHRWSSISDVPISDLNTACLIAFIPDEVLKLIAGLTVPIATDLNVSAIVQDHYIKPVISDKQKIDTNVSSTHVPVIPTIIPAKATSTWVKPTTPSSRVVPVEKKSDLSENSLFLNKAIPENTPYTKNQLINFITPEIDRLESRMNFNSKESLNKDDKLYILSNIVNYINNKNFDDTKMFTVMKLAHSICCLRRTLTETKNNKKTTTQKHFEKKFPDFKDQPPALHAKDIVGNQSVAELVLKINGTTQNKTAQI